MAEDKKITQLTENSSPLVTDEMEIVDDPGSSPLSQFITVGNLLNSGLITDVGTLAAGDADAIVSAASTTVAGKSEYATQAEVNSATASKTVTPDVLKGSMYGYTYARNTSDVTVGNTTDETSIYSSTITGNDMGTTGWLKITCLGTIANDSGGNAICTVKLKLGSTTVATATATLIDGTGNEGMRFQGYIANTSATAQKAWLAAETLTSLNQSRGLATIGTGAEDTTGNLTLDMTVQWDLVDASTTLTRSIAIVEIMP